MRLVSRLEVGSSCLVLGGCGRGRRFARRLGGDGEGVEGMS